MEEANNIVFSGSEGQANHVYEIFHSTCITGTERTSRQPTNNTPYIYLQ